MVAERRPLPQVEDVRRQAQPMERSSSARALQQHGLRVALTHTRDAKEGSNALLKVDRRDLNKKKDVQVPPPYKAWTPALVRKVYTS